MLQFYSHFDLTQISVEVHEFERPTTCGRLVQDAPDGDPAPGRNLLILCHILSAFIVIAFVTVAHVALDLGRVRLRPTTELTANLR